jgi:hypothetical protein
LSCRSLDDIEQCNQVCVAASQRALGGFLKPEGVPIYGFLLGAAKEGGEPARIHSLDSHELVFFLQTSCFESCCVFRMSLELSEMHVHESSLHRLHDRDTPSACIQKKTIPNNFQDTFPHISRHR